MTNVYFVRHAESDNRVHDNLLRPLTEKGTGDCKLVTGFLMDKGISRMYSSPLKRAMDTLGGLSPLLGIPIIPLNAFAERKISDGWVDDYLAYAQSQWRDFSFKLPGGESLREVQARNIEALLDILRRHPGESIAIGSHGTALSTVVNHYDPAFGYEQFLEIVDLMPWLVHLSFDGTRCAGIRFINLFEQ